MCMDIKHLQNDNASEHQVVLKEDVNYPLFVDDVTSHLFLFITSAFNSICISIQFNSASWSSHLELIFRI